MHPIVEHLERTDLVALWGNEIHVPATLFRYEFKTGIAPSKLGKGGRDVTITPRKPFDGTLRVERPPSSV
jgi:hypothetical protein